MIRLVIFLGLVLSPRIFFPPRGENEEKPQNIEVSSSKFKNPPLGENEEKPRDLSSKIRNPPRGEKTLRLPRGHLGFSPRGENHIHRHKFKAYIAIRRVPLNVFI
jgi:hypothetical protein